MCYTYTVVSVAMADEQYTCAETTMSCSVFVELSAPEDGIACDVIVFLAPMNGSKAGKPSCLSVVDLLLRTLTVYNLVSLSL